MSSLKGGIKRLERGLFACFLGELNYTGKELKNGWLFERCPDAVGYDWIAVFEGSAFVREEMVDYEDRVRSDFIESPRMWQFIGEFYGMDMLAGVLWQRVLVDTVRKTLKEVGYSAEREGDDLIVGKKKLSVSIATKTAGSVLIHFGMNVVPVEKWGWVELETVGFTKLFFDKLFDEWEGVQKACRKVVWR